MKGFLFFLIAMVISLNTLAESVGANAEKINLNTATISDLTKIKGLGPSKAKAIIQYRDSVGGFRSYDELLLVNGVGPKLVEVLKEQTTLKPKDSEESSSN